MVRLSLLQSSLVFFLVLFHRHYSCFLCFFRRSSPDANQNRNGSWKVGYKCAQWMSRESPENHRFSLLLPFRTVTHKKIPIIVLQSPATLPFKVSYYRFAFDDVTIL